MAEWAKLTTDYYLDAAVAWLDDSAEVAFTRAIAYAGNQETGGFIPQAILPVLVRRYTPARARKVAGQLVTAGLWVPMPGGWSIRSWAQVNSDLDALAERRRADRERQARHRAASRDCHVTDPDPKNGTNRNQARPGEKTQPKSSSDHETDSAQPDPVENSSPQVNGTSPPGQSRDCHVTVRTPEAEVDTKPACLLTYISRQAGGNAQGLSANDLPPELIEQWQEIAGPRVNLEREARAYIAHYADRPARNERSAWVGWLRRARSHAETAAPPPDTPGRPLVVACSDPLCIGGWLPSAPDKPARPCLLCRPHLVRQPTQDSAVGVVL